MMIVLILCSIAFIACLYFEYRNDKVYRFLKGLNNDCSKILINYLNNASWTERPIESQKTYKKMDVMADSIRELEYNKLLFSFKPLKVEYWLTHEQIAFLNGNWPNEVPPIAESVPDVMLVLGLPDKGTFEREKELLDKITEKYKKRE